jgi:hypothetical protein
MYNFIVICVFLRMRQWRAHSEKLVWYRWTKSALRKPLLITHNFIIERKGRILVIFYDKNNYKNVYCVHIPLCRSVKTNTRHTVFVKQWTYILVPCLCLFFFRRKKLHKDFLKTTDSAKDLKKNPIFTL